MNQTIQRKPIVTSLYAPSPDVRRYTWKAHRCIPLTALQVVLVVGVVAVIIVRWWF